MPTTIQDKLKKYNADIALKRKGQQLDTDIALADKNYKPNKRVEAEAIGNAPLTSTSIQQQVAAKAAQTPPTAAELEAARLLDEENKRASSINLLNETTANLVDGIQARVNPVTNWFASQPTPGGITALLLFIAFMVMVVLPVNANGDTRLNLLYQTLLTKTHMKYNEGATPPATGGGGPPNIAAKNNVVNGVTVQPFTITGLNMFGMD